MNDIKNDILLRKLAGEKTERPPIWMMRQAGRILPQYRAIRGSLSGFIELVQTPNLAAEVTIQPVDELDVDAAIIFSDILVIPEAMGLDYELIEKKGPFFPKTIESEKDVDLLIEGSQASDQLEYVFDALSITKKELAGRVPLIGFSGAPWTLMSYMIEGQGSKTFSKAKKFLYQNPKAAHKLLQKITNTIISYCQSKIASGANVIQIFDSWAGVLDQKVYQEFCVPYLKQIGDAIEDVPTILFAKGAWFAFDDIKELNYSAFGVDWNIPIDIARKRLGNRVLQGNLDPCQLYASPEEIATKAISMCDKFGLNHIANLGHGVYPDTPLDHVKAFIQAVKNYRY